MAIITPFPVERCRSAQPTNSGKSCLVIPFPGRPGATVKLSTKRRDKHGKPMGIKNSTVTRAVLTRIEAVLAKRSKLRNERLSWDYAAGILKEQTGLDYLDQATVRELHNVEKALKSELERQE